MSTDRNQPPSEVHQGVSPQTSEIASADADADADSVPSTQTQRKAQRARNGCLVCRSRRVKCDLARPECQRCVKYGAECQYPAKKTFDPVAVEKALRRRHHPPSRSSTTPNRDAGSLAGKSDLPLASTSANPVPKHSVSQIQKDEDRRGAETSSFRSSGPSTLVDRIEPMGPIEYINALNRTTRMGQFFSSPVEPPNFLRIAFPHEDDLRCFHHCMTYTLSIIVVNEERNTWVEDIAPLFLFPSGLTPTSTEALKVSMLSLGAAHLSYLQAKGSHVGQQPIPRDLGYKYRSQAIKLLRQARSSSSELASDAFLAACPMLLVHDIFAAYPHWREVHRLALHAIRHRGGCEQMLFGNGSTAVTSQAQATLPWSLDGVSSAVKHQPSRALRCIVESLVLHDIVASLTIAEPCALLSDTSDWWEKLDNRSIDGVDSIETMCGMHRSIFRLTARTLSLVSESRRLGRTVALPSSLSSPLFPVDPLHSLNAEYKGRISAHMVELQNWLSNPTLLFSAQRTLNGSMAMWHSLNVISRRFLLGQSRSETEIQQSAKAILQICSSAGDKIEILNWPLIIACSVLLDSASRESARDLLKTFGYQCCVEIQVAQELVEECWRRIDQGLDDEACSWWEILQELGLPVLLG